MPKRELLGMVRCLQSAGYMLSPSVREAMLGVDRGCFVPAQERELAYTDNALPVGHGQTISAPGVVAFMLEKLGVGMGMKVLDVGTGSGYNCALLAELVGPKGKVISIDIVPELVELAKSNIRRAGKEYPNLEFVCGDGSCGYGNGAPYDRIIVTAAMPSFSASHPLAAQLKPDGKLVAPVGGYFYQDLIVYDKKSGRIEPVLPVMFVPLVGECGFPEK